MVKDVANEFENFTKIIKENYYNNETFKEELFKYLKMKTGNNNISALCGYIIDNSTKIDCDKIAIFSYVIS